MDPFELNVELGQPGKTLRRQEPSIGLQGGSLVNNATARWATAGVRIIPDRSVEGCFRFARAMSLENEAVRLALGMGRSTPRGDSSQLIDSHRG